MEVKCIDIEKAKKTIYILTREYKRPVSGAVLNIIIKNLFTGIICDINTNLGFQEFIYDDIRVSLFAPAIFNIKAKGMKQQKDKLFKSIDPFLFNSHVSLEIDFPSDLNIIEGQMYSGGFKYYSLYKKYKNTPQKHLRVNGVEFSQYEKMVAVENFYNVLLKNNSSEEGTLIQILVFQLLFNSLYSDETDITASGLKKIRSIISEESAKYEKDKFYNFSKYETGDFEFNELEHKILREYILTFSQINSENKPVICHIFNEFSKNTI